MASIDYSLFHPNTQGSDYATPVTTVASSPSANFGIFHPGTFSPTPSALPSPLSGQPSAPLSGDNDSWMKKAWNWANTPLTTSLFGMPEERAGAGGFERGLEHIAAGFTSPLSIALTLATFGTGGLIESAGATALKEAGLTAAEIADVTKGSQAALGAMKEMKPMAPVIDEALQAAHTPEELNLLKLAREKLDPLSMGRSASYGEDFYQGKAGEAGMLEKAGFTPE